MIRTNLLPAEMRAIQAAGLDPRDYAAVPCDVVLDMNRPGAVADAPTPSGGTVRVVCQPMTLLVPAAAVVLPRIIPAGASGIASPLAGMIPVLSARVVVPRERLSPLGRDVAARESRLAALPKERPAVRRESPEVELLPPPAAESPDPVRVLLTAARRVANAHGDEYDCSDLAEAADTVERLYGEAG